MSENLVVTIIGAPWTKYRYLQAAATRKAIRLTKKKFRQTGQRIRKMETHGRITTEDAPKGMCKYTYLFKLFSE